MKKSMIMVLVLALTLLCFQASAENGTYMMAGYDSESAGHTWSTNVFMQRMEERTGVSFSYDQFTDAARWKACKASYVADGVLPDVLFKAELTDAEIYDLFEKGVIIDLKPYLEQYAPNLSALLAEHPEWENAITLKNGAIPALPNLNELQNNCVMWINTAWMKTLGIDKMPETAEELTQVLRAFKEKDPNRNYKDDEVPLSFVGMWELRFLSHAFGVVTNDYYVCLDEQGRVTSPLNSDRYRAFISWLHDLWKEDLIGHNGFVINDAMRQITDEKAVIPYGMFLTSTPVVLVPSGALENYTALAPLKYEGKQIYRDFLGDVVKGAFAVTSACKEPEKMVAWVDAFYGTEVSNLALYGQEDSEYVFNESGYWDWNATPQEVIYSLMPMCTLSEGGVLPGITTADMQLKYADKNTRNAIISLKEFKQYTSMPVPQLTLDPETRKQLDEIQGVLSPYVEDMLACFVCGDVELNDANWGAFLLGMQERGMDRMISVWQGALTR